MGNFPRLRSARPGIIGKAAHLHDPRLRPSIGQPQERAAAFDPQMQPDQIISSEPIFDNAQVPLPDVINRLYNPTVPPQIRQGAMQATIVAVNAPVLLIPSNTRRMSFMLANLDLLLNIFFSYDFPVTGANGALLGIPLSPLAIFQETNGTVSINDIYVFAPILPGGPNPYIPVIAYEGGLSIEGRYNG